MKPKAVPSSPGPGGQAASSGGGLPSGGKADRGDPDPGFRRGAPKVSGLRPIDWNKTRNNSRRGSSGTRAAITAPAGKAASEKESRRSSLDFVRKDADGTKGSAASPSGGGDASAAGAGGGSGAGGGGAGPEIPDGEVPLESPVDKIRRLSGEIASQKKKAASEKKKAEILAATGNHPAAVYHYERSRKAEKKADALNDELQAVTTELTDHFERNSGAPSAQNGP